MSSYYKKITGDISPGKLARSEDIHLIQSSIQDMISRVIVDLFGPAFILGHDENLLTLTPVPSHIDQQNTNYDSNNCWLSFYERYLAQIIQIEKSEIHTIKTHMRNTSNLTVTVFAEIRDLNENLIKEVNVKLEPTGDEPYQEVNFEFNIQHLPIGSYMFIIRSLDLSEVDLSINGDESFYDTITPDMFEVKYDKNGSYNNGLYASYNGKDYLESLLLEDLYVNEDTIVELLPKNPDLYFEQIFSKGNTYVITPGPAIILGEKVYPVDTHISIDGPSTMGDRVDLVTLTNDGRLNVIKGNVYNGTPSYPVSNVGLKIAYITSYKSSLTSWECPNCGFINEGNLDCCNECKTPTNIKIPLIEQADDNQKTRERDVLERIRRLEKKVSYDMDRNAPSRIKYICTLDPFVEKKTYTNVTDKNGNIEIVEDTEGNYGYTSTVNDNGDVVYIPETGYKIEQLYYSIKSKENDESIPEYIKDGDDSFYKDGVSVDTSNGKITLQKITNNEEFSKNKTLKELGTYKSQEITYTIKGNSDLGELNSEYAVQNFTFTRDTYIKSITPYITKFQNIENFGIILFRNDEVFNLMKNTRVCYQKKFRDDETFPNVFESELKSLQDAQTQNSGIVNLTDPITFDVNQTIPAGNYSLMVYGTLKDGAKEGIIYITEYTTLSETDNYGVSTKCLGTTNPSIVYLETNNISNRSWDVVFEKRNSVYFDRGILISQSYSTNQKIYSCSISKNYNIPAGCSIDTYVSNNGGKTWVNASNGNITFSGSGNSFKFKIVLNGNGKDTPEINYNSTSHYALLFNIGTALEYIQWEDYKSCFETKVFDGNRLTNFLLSQDVEKRFSEWEFCRLWISYIENMKVDICFSNDEESIVYLDAKKENLPKTMFADTILADLEKSDFSQTSVDYDNYDDSVEPDEYNYEFNLQEDYQYNYHNGEIITTGVDGLGNINDDTINNDDFYYTTTDGVPLVGDGDLYSNTSGYTSGVFRVPNMKKEEIKYYTNWSDPYFDSSKIIIGKQFPNGLKINENYQGMRLVIVPNLAKSEDSGFDKATRYYVGNKMAIPAGTLEVVISLNINGAIEEDNATYGRAYTINQDLIDGTFNNVTMPAELAQDLYAYGSIKSIGLRLKNKPMLKTEYNEEEIEYSQTLRCCKVGDNEYLSDSLGLGVILLTSYNIQPVIPYSQIQYTWQILKENDKNKIFAIWIPKIIQRENGPLEQIGVPNNSLPTEEMKKQFPQGAGLLGAVPIGIKDSPSRDSLGKPIYDENGYLTGKSLSDYDNTIQTLYKDARFLSTRFWAYDDNYQSGGVYWAINNETGSYAKYNHKKTFTDLVKEGIECIQFHLGENETGNLFKIDVNTPITTKNLIRFSYSVPEYYINNPISSDNQTYSNAYYTEGNFNKGDIYIDFYDTQDIESGVLPIQSFPLPAWGRLQSNSTKENKICNAIFKKRTDSNYIKSVVIRRENPRGEKVLPVTLELHDIVLYHADNLPMLGPKMWVRLYPNNFNETEIPSLRKYGAIWKLK